MTGPLLIDAELWKATRTGARAGRGFRYQDAVGAWLTVAAWHGDVPWRVVVPEGVEDVTLHGPDREYRCQLKARHTPQARFTVSEVAQHIAKTARGLPDGWEADEALRIALVLERPVEGLDATGWDRALAVAGESSATLENALAAALGPEAARARALLRRTHLIAEPEPIEQALDLLQAVELPPAALRLLMHKLREIAVLS